MATDRVSASLHLTGTVLAAYPSKNGEWVKLIIATDGAQNLSLMARAEAGGTYQKGDLYEGPVRVSIDRDRNTNTVRGLLYWAE